jgi:XTP/dITP diphosphohydrolase
MEKSMNIILSTRNPSKAEQIKSVFTGVLISVLTLADAGIEGEAVEDGETLEENALKKALFAHRAGEWSMADDTGLFINALRGKPGIHAARWAGETATTGEITSYTLKQLEGATDRSATFKTVVALISPEGKHQFFVGEVLGVLLESPRVPPQPKMPYSPLFVPEGSSKVWAEMTTEEENAISHRGKAFRLVREHLMSFLK